MPIEYLFLLPLIGLVTGLLAGLFGVGGGIVVVPALSYLFFWLDPAGGIRMHTAVGTSLAASVFTSIPAVIMHHRAGVVLWRTVARLAPAMAVGSAAGAGLAAALSGTTLSRIVATVVLIAAVYLAAGRQPRGRTVSPGPLLLGISGSAVGVVSALAGIGGGLLITPLLLWLGRGIHEAVGTAATCTLAVALAGAAGFILTGATDGAGMPYSSGYVFWPAVLGIATGSMIAAALGARLAHKTPAIGLRRLLALFLAVVGVAMFLR